MNVDPVGRGGGVAQPAPAVTTGKAFADILAAAIDSTQAAVGSADDSAAAVAAGGGSVMQAALDRARADVALEIASVAASRVSGALNSLLQTQV